MTNPFGVAPRLAEVRGKAEGWFAPLADIFARLVADQGVGAAALAVHHRGELVVELVGGDGADDHIQLLFSATKPITAVAAAHAEAAGLLDLDAPLADVWPAFDRMSTREITPRMVLSHRAGLPAFDPDPSFEDLLAGAGDDIIGRQEPYWKPGAAHGYHSFTYGLLIDNVFRRVVGQTVGEYVERELSRPNALDVWIGIPEDLLPRVHPTVVAEQWSTPMRAEFARSSRIPPGTSQRLRGRSDFVNDPRLLTACWPAISGTASARSLSRLFALTIGDAGSYRLLAPDTLDRMVRVQSSGPDRVLAIETAFGSGVQRPFPQFPMLGPASFGHEGANGCFVVVDPERELSVAFTTSVFPPVSGGAVRGIALLGALRLLVDRHA